MSVEADKNGTDRDGRVSTGSAGLDYILRGGLDPNRMYLYEGRPGTGKTTIALQFLLEGARQGERVLYITLSETEQELKLVAERHGWSLDDVDVFELVPPESTLDPSRELTVLHPAELELSETTKLVFDRVAELNPSRIVFDSLSELRLLAQNPLRYRRQVLALKHFFTSRQCTVILLDDLTSQENDLQLHSISHGVVRLEQLALDYGAERRRLRVVKMRAAAIMISLSKRVGLKSSRALSPPSITRPLPANSPPAVTLSSITFLAAALNGALMLYS